MMTEHNQTDLAEQHEMRPFDLLTLEPIRTICEKIMSLVRFSYSENPMEDLKKKIRHTYDLHQLLAQQEFLDFLHSQDFDNMILKVAADDVASFRNNNQWLAFHPNESIIFKDLENSWRELQTAYTGDFKNLVYGRLPNEEAILTTLKLIKARLDSVTWNIQP